MEQIRLDRFLANSGCGTRSEVKKQIRQGLVTVNGSTEKDADRKVVPSEDEICLRGKPVLPEGEVWYMLHKPAGVVTAVHDSRKKTVMDLMDLKGKKLFPVGRLDLDTEGLLLITGDGAMAHRLLSPAWHVEKTYEAVVSGMVTEEHIRLFENGIDIGDDKPTKPARLEQISGEKELWQKMELLRRENGDVSCVRVVIREGRYHQVRRMFAAVGMEVLYLRRTAFGPLTLDPGLEKGNCRRLSEDEVGLLREAVKGV